MLSDVEDVCDRVVIYYGGKIQAMGTLNELLATPDAVRITAPILPRPTLEKVLEVIRHDVEDDKVRIDTPTQNLESYFLNVVQKARAQDAETSGATSGNRVAAYLREGEGGTQAPDVQARLLDRLSRKEEAPAPAAAVPVVNVTDVESAQNRKLENLTRQEEPAPAPPQAAPPEEKKKEDLSKANEKLSSLLGKPK